MGEAAVVTRATSGTGAGSAVHKHVQVREYVRALVEGADPGTPAPSERELVQYFGVARMTVRQALDALVTELACAGGRSADGRVVEPWVAADPEQVVVVFAVVASEGVQTCPSNPASRVTVDLGEPLGNRRLLDGGRFPAGDPAQPDL